MRTIFDTWYVKLYIFVFFEREVKCSNEDTQRIRFVLHVYYKCSLCDFIQLVRFVCKYCGIKRVLVISFLSPFSLLHMLKFSSFNLHVTVLEKMIGQWNFRYCSYDAIATTIYFLQLIGCMGFSIVVTIAPYEQLHWISCNLFLR